MPLCLPVNQTNWTPSARCVHRRSAACGRRLPPEDIWMDKLEGALLGRIIGCLLGVPVEGLSVESMRAWSEYIGKPFPPVSYWEEVQNPELWNCYGRQRGEYRKCALRSAPVDDDLAYTQLALLILEEYGPDFTTEDVGEAWKKYLPVACTAEQAALDNLKKACRRGRLRTGTIRSASGSAPPSVLTDLAGQRPACRSWRQKWPGATPA